MTDAQYEAYETYLRELAKQLLLQDWEIDLDRSRPTTEDAWAEISILRTENYGRVLISWPGFFTLEPEKQREYLIHELIHCHFTRMQNVVMQLAEHHDGDPATSFAQKAWIREMEIAVQRLARILAPQLPLPPQLPKGGKAME